MNKYFSNFIGKFGGEALRLTSFSEFTDRGKSSPKINFIALYNPSWVNDDDQGFEGLSRQILFFVTPQNLKEAENGNENSPMDEKKLLREQLNMIGLIRGSCSLLSDFGSTEGPTVLNITGGAIIVVQIERDYFLAISLIFSTDDSRSNSTSVLQLVNLAKRAHRMFELIHRPLPKLLKLHGKDTFCKILRDQWVNLMINFNLGADLHFGPPNILWPNHLNYRGVFELFPKNCYKKSSVKFSEASIKELDNLVFSHFCKPTGYIVASMEPLLTKHAGVLHMNLGSDSKLEKTSIIDLYNLFECVGSSYTLTSEFFAGVNTSEDIYTLLRKKWQKLSEIIDHEGIDSQDEPDEENFASVSSFAMLNPVRLTNTLVVLPINGTVNGFKNLSLAVTELIYEAPNLLSKLNCFISMQQKAKASHTDNADEPSTSDRSERYLIGLMGNEISRFLAHIPTVYRNDSKTATEYLLVVYKQNEILTILFYESGTEGLGNVSFYENLRTDLFRPLFDLIGMAVADMTPQLSSSINSLPDPIETAVHAHWTEMATSYQEIDSDFFFIIYDTTQLSYQTSLPDLRVVQPLENGFDKRRLLLSKVMFHLHDHLIAHLIVEANWRILELQGTVYEHLHKFSGSRTSDWIFYSMQHKEKVIVVIRNSNHKTKAKPTPSPQNKYLIQVADSVYGAANLGFLESLGVDVRMWLGGVEKGPDEGIRHSDMNS